MMKKYIILTILALSLSSCKTTQRALAPQETMDDRYAKTFHKFYQEPSSVDFDDLFYDYLDSSHFIKNANNFSEFEQLENQFYAGAIDCKKIDFLSLLLKMALVTRVHSLALDCAESLDNQELMAKHEKMIEQLIKGYFKNVDGLSHHSAIKVSDWGEPEDILNLIGYQKIDAYAQTYAKGSLYSYVVIAEHEEDGTQREFYFNTWDALEKRFGRSEDAFDIYDFDYSLGTLFKSLGDNHPGFKYAYARYLWKVDPDNAQKAIIEAANEGNLKALEVLAAEIIKGKKISDYTKDNAIDLFVTAAERGYAKAYLYLSYFYRDGQLLAKDIKSAESLLVKAEGKLGKAESYYFLAKVYNSFNKGNSERIKWLKLASDLGSHEADLDLYRHYSELDKDKAQNYLNTAIKKGSALASYLKAVNYLQKNRDNFVKKSKEVEELLLKGSERVPAAHLLLSVFYNLPEHKNNIKRVSHLLKAAVNGDDNAQVSLARLLATGAKGVARNPAEANRWYNQAVKQLNEVAMINLGYRYEKGYGSPRNVKLSQVLYQAAAERGNSQAMFNLGYILLKGEIVEQDIINALEWLNKAAKLEHPAAINELGLEFQKGESLEKSEPKAVEYFKKAADLGSKYAMYNLGIAYKNGVGLEQDMVKAKEWLQKAFEAGNTGAISELKNL